MEQNYYQELGISTSADRDEIKSAFKKLAKEYHPDKNPGSHFHEDKFKKINTAYQTLSDPIKKSTYDLKLQYQNFIPPKHNYKYTPPTPSPKGFQKKKPNAKKISESKVYMIVLSVFIFTGFSGYVMYGYMNNYTANLLYEEGIKLENKDRFREAFMVFTDAISYNSELSEAYAHRALARVKALGDFKGAEYDYTNALSTAKYNFSSLYFERAKCFIQQKKYSYAISDLDSSIIHNKGIDSSYYYRAEVYYSLENYKKAIPDYEKFHSAFPDCNDCMLKSGYSLYKTGNYTDAQEKINTLIHDFPENAELYYYRGMIYRANKNQESSCTDMKKAYELGFKGAVVFLEDYCGK